MYKFLASFTVVLFMALPSQAQTVSFGAGQPTENAGSIGAAGIFDGVSSNCVIAVRFHILYEDSTVYHDYVAPTTWKVSDETWFAPQSGIWSNGTYVAGVELIYIGGFIPTIRTVWSAPVTFYITDSWTP